MKLKQGDIFFLFEDRVNKNRSKLFSSPIKRIVAYNKKELYKALEEIDNIKDRGYLAGYISYEAGYYLVDKFNIVDKNYKTPLLEFYSFNSFKLIENRELDQYFNKIDKKSYIHNLKLNNSKEQYIKKIEKIKEEIYNGETYQINYTISLDFEFTNDSLTLYKELREKQIVEYGAFLNLKDRTIISLSPELFLDKKGEIIVAKPMKGTYPIGKTEEEDIKNILFMKNNEKIISENLMIVDLIRNDIGRIAKPNSVTVENIFEVLSYKTLHQMISTVKGVVKKEILFKDIIRNLFPSGSITGAPKIRTMEIIKELELKNRDIYTGSIGYITPENDFIFNVAIRTIIIENSKATIGIGGGILYDSNPEEEWEEALLKSKFLIDLNKDIIILETFLFDGKKILRFEKHLKRLENSVKYFGINFDKVFFLKKIDNLIKDLTSSYKIRARVKSDNFIIKIEKFQKNRKNRVVISDKLINSNDLFRRYKTNFRKIYNSEYDKIPISSNIVDTIFFNDKNNLAEASRHNIYIKENEKLYTPPILDGALPGIMREVIIDEKNVIVESISRERFNNAEKIYLSNSVNSFFEVYL